MAVYEVVLRFLDREEVRLTDRPMGVGDSLDIAGSRWFVERHQKRRGRADRYVCVESSDERSDGDSDQAMRAALSAGAATSSSPRRAS